MTDLPDHSPNSLRDRIRRAADRGASVVEYALLVALIAMVCLASIQVLGGDNEGSINKTAERYASATN